jgi:GntR family transcriptional regulator
MPPRTTPTTQNPAQHRDRTGEAPAAGDTRQRQRREPAHARYQQVADALREQITTGVLPPASPLPSETELMAAFGISRPTARAAIAALRAEGLITVLHGKGSFVRRGEDRALHTHPRAIGLTQARPGKLDTPEFTDAEGDAKGQGWQVVETPARYRTTATPALALALGTGEHSPLFVYDRLLSGPAGQRIAHRLYLPFATCAEVAALEHNPYREPGELYGLLAGHYGHLSFTETVRARMPTPDDSATLHIPTGTPMLFTQRTTHTTPTRALALEQSRLSAEDTQLAYTLTPQPQTP